MTISLRNLPPELEQAIVDKSQRERISLNKAATQLIAFAIHPPHRNTDFDEFAGTWPAKAAAEFDAALADMRRVDPEDWKR